MNVDCHLVNGEKWANERVRSDTAVTFREELACAPTLLAESLRRHEARTRSQTGDDFLICEG
jgi:hypothetical protein